MTYEQTLLELSRADESLLVMTAENRAAIRNLPEPLGDRFIDVGICEQTMVGMAAGLALRGRRPVCHALATFLVLRAYEFIRTDVGIPGLPVTFVGGVPGFLSEANGPTHQAIEDIALMRSIPQMRVFCPADQEELVAMLPLALKGPGPAYIRYYAGPAPVSHKAPFVEGRAEICSEGGDVSILTYGFLLREAEAARKLLEARGIRVRLVNMRSLEPVDEATIVRCALESRCVVTLEDHFLRGGLTTIVHEVLGHHQVKARVVPMALEGRWFRPGLLDAVLKFEGMDGPSIASRIEKVLTAGATP